MINRRSLTDWQAMCANFTGRMPRVRATTRWAIVPSTTMTRGLRSRVEVKFASSVAKYELQACCSSVVGALPGGTHLTTLVIRLRYSLASSGCGVVASPARCNAANKNFPLASPTNALPVRPAPCSPGAKPTIQIKGRVDPHEPTGAAWKSGKSNLIRCRSATSRGHLRQFCNLATA